MASRPCSTANRPAQPGQAGQPAAQPGQQGQGNGNARQQGPGNGQPQNGPQAAAARDKADSDDTAAGLKVVRD